MEQDKEMKCAKCGCKIIIGYPIGRGKKHKVYCKKCYEIIKGVRDEKGNTN